MDNIQLYRTNILLGGQMKWDIILNSSNKNNLEVSDFHLSPISSMTPYNRYVDEHLLNYSHQENIKKYYSKLSGSFYENCVDSSLEANCPIVSQLKDKDLHVGDFEMGCKRAKYKVHNKQYEFFCPIWLEQLSENDVLEFELCVFTGDSKVLVKKNIKFSYNEIYSEYHNKFVNYFKEYIKYTGIDKGNDNIMSIHLDKNIAQVSGLNINTGILNTFDISYIVSDLIYRERPLLEFDNIIINQLKDHKLIVPQLFNFNFFFNPHDILPQNMYNLFLGKCISFGINVKINGVKLNIKDFYSNYEYISKKLTGTLLLGTETAPNVLDYLEDYKYIGLVDKNKMIQNTIHWSLVGNNNYIFNVYDGFAGYTYLDHSPKDIIYQSHLYDNSADIRSEYYKQALNSLSWCNCITIKNSSKENNISLPTFWNNLNYFMTYASDFSSNIEWVNNIKYGEVKKQFNQKILLIVSEAGPILKDPSKNLINELGIEVFIEDNVLFVCAEKSIDNSRDKLTFKGFKKLLNSIIESNVSEEYKEMINNILLKLNQVADSDNPPVITINKSLYSYRDHGPSPCTNEIIYYKNDNKKSYVLRYSGKIKPTFLSENDINYNYMYFKDHLTEEEYKKSIYYQYSNTLYKPLYPSIGYFPIKKIKADYKYFDELKNILNSIEYHWYNSGKTLVLENNIEIHTTSILTKGDVKNYVKQYIKEFYNVNDEGLNDYIYNLYTISNKYDYINDSNINDYNYTIKLTLK